MNQTERERVEAVANTLNPPLCAHCYKPAAGWTPEQARRGWRTEQRYQGLILATTKHYHCVEASVN